MATTFPALPGFYSLLFLHFEPISTFTAAVTIWFYPGTSWYFHELIPSPTVQAPETVLDARSQQALWHVANCYFLLGLISSFGFRAIRKTLRDRPLDQEELVAATLKALAIADHSHIAVTLLSLPPSIAFDPSSWNTMVHGNVTFTTFLFISRMAWFFKLGREDLGRTQKRA
ncbi:hypothetical protein BOTBODRAFT_36670 [Botryobasidium botryosum FD-172 SS1]|uniref:DUF7704 domain-containing protein n=1 Tax=Botryobasidium botryosum (strain FD-172 SS1) TaxID=930990 RepID=A0A067M592_BOTB1|nr:hypothetical protein BOTBODRAFT_36670 [Botryobasidium botryosum FD-172 SS1]